MRADIIRRLMALALSLVMIILTVAAPDTYAAPGDSSGDELSEFTISSADEFHEIMDNCIDAHWSKGKCINLDADISFEAGDFVSIPYFAGELNGKGHTISGVNIEETISVTGLFSECTKTAYIHDLTVKGDINPDGNPDSVGGIVGRNSGRIKNCTFRGTISGYSNVGGIVGINTKNGEVSGCVNYGAVSGSEKAGGIAGTNKGAVKVSFNLGNVNTGEPDTIVTIDDLAENLSDFSLNKIINDVNEPGTSTNVGGIAGYNSGTIEQCTNSADVGYNYMGYNIGGGVGDNTGLLLNDINSGVVLGRDKVGGIAGIMEPDLEVTYDEEKITELRSQMSELNVMMKGTLDHAGTSSSDISARLARAISSLEEAEKYADEMVGGAVSYADDLTEKLNKNMDVLEQAVTELSAEMKEFDKALDSLETAGEALIKETENFIDQFKLSDEDEETVKNDLENLRTGMSEIAVLGDRLTRSIDDLETDMNSLRAIAERSGLTLENISRHVSNITGDVSGMMSAVAKISSDLNDDLIPAVRGISDIVGRYMSNLDIDNVAISRAITDMNTGIDDVTAGLTETIAVLSKFVEKYGPEQLINGFDEDYAGQLTESMSKVSGGIEKMGSGEKALNDQLAAIMTSADMSDADRTALKSYLSRLNKAFDELSTDGRTFTKSISTFSAHMDSLRKDIDTVNENSSEFEKYMRAIRSDLSVISDEVSGMMSVVNKKVIPSMNSLSEIAEKYIFAIDDSALRGSIDDFMTTLKEMPDIATNMSTIIDTLLEDMDTDIPELGTDVRDAGENMYDSLLNATEEIEELSLHLGDDSVLLTNDIKDISDQINTISQTLVDAVEDLSNMSLMPADHMRDISQGDMTVDEISAVTKGRIGYCKNAGSVTGTSRTGGIVGFMDAESDLLQDLKLKKIGTLSADYVLVTSSVVNNCVNSGVITARRDRVGGITGDSESGLVTMCENYGDVGASGADYVGGIGGFSGSAVRKCITRGTIRGRRFVGGIAGYGTILSENIAMVKIPEAVQEYGAVAGAVETRNKTNVYDNYFIPESGSADMYVTERMFGAVSGIGLASFKGMAEATYYEKVEDAVGVYFPDAMKIMRIRFLNDSDVIGEIVCNYGDSIDAAEIPAVPEREGYYGEWDRRDFSDVRDSDDIQAIYTMRTTTIASEAKRDGRQSVVIAEGDFGNDAALTATELEPLDFERERWHITLENTDAVSYHFLPAESGTVMIVDPESEDGTGYRMLDTEEFGRYRVFAADEKDLVLVVVSSTTENMAIGVVVVIVLIAATVVVIFIVLMVRRRKRKKSEKSHKKA